MSTEINDLVKKSIMEAMQKAGASTTEANATAQKALEESIAALPEPELKVLKNQMLASKLLGVAVKPDFVVDIVVPKDVPEEIRMFIPEVDPTYQVQKDEAIAILRAVQDGDKMLVVGPTGSGKSSLLSHLCALTKRPMVRINMTGDVESSSIFGQVGVEAGATVWKDGPATQAVRYGAVLVIDEWEVTPPEIMMGFQWLLEDGGKLFLKERPGKAEDNVITPHPSFRIACLGNTLGQGDDTGSHAGTNVQNTATLDRFDTTVVVAYLDPTHEENVLTSVVKGLDKTLAKKMVKVAGLVRTAHQQTQVSLTMSPRTLIRWGEKIAKWRDAKLSFELAFLNKFRDNERKVVQELYKKVFGA